MNQFSKITLEARAMRREYLAGLLLNAWHAVFNRMRMFQSQRQGVA